MKSPTTHREHDRTKADAERASRSLERVQEPSATTRCHVDVLQEDVREANSDPRKDAVTATMLQGFSAIAAETESGGAVA